MTPSPPFQKQMSGIRPHIFLFLFLFFTGIIFAGWKLSDELFHMGFLLESLFHTVRTGDLSLQGFLMFFLQKRMPLWGILCACGFLCKKKLPFWVATGWFGLTGGIFFSILMEQFALKSILPAAAMLLPQMLIYVLCYRMLVMNRLHREWLCVPKLVLLTGLYLCGVLCEYAVSPWLIRHMYGLVRLLP